MTDLRSLQSELAKALTDRAYRQQPAESQESSSDASPHPLAGLSRGELERSSETLVRKRISQTRYALPLTAETLGLRFADLFREFCDRRHYNGRLAWAEDAIEFAKWLREQKVAPEWIVEVACWEALSIREQISRFSLRFHFFSYDVARWTIHRKQTPQRRRNVWISLRCGRLSMRRRII